MRKPKLIPFILFLLPLFKLNAGCCLEVHIKKVGDPDTKEFTLYFANYLPEVHFNLTDSFTIRTFGCCDHGEIKNVYLDGVLLPLSLSYPCKPGNYSIEAYSIHTGKLPFCFTISRDLVGLSDYKNESGRLTLSPNPARESITIDSPAKELKSITVFDFSSQIIESVEISGNRVSIPLNNYPPGIYFVKIATIAEKPTIKRFIVQ